MTPHQVLRWRKLAYGETQKLFAPKEAVLMDYCFSQTEQLSLALEIQCFYGLLNFLGSFCMNHRLQLNNLVKQHYKLDFLPLKAISSMIHLVYQLLNSQLFLLWV